jgi:hypothetical protein
MIYELRIYDILPGRMAAINNRFTHTTSRFSEKHGLGRLREPRPPSTICAG